MRPGGEAWPRGARTAERRLRALYGRYGLGALFLSRFLPGVRAMVPPLAGALRLAPGGPILAIATASGIWYGLVTWLAFRAGASWSELQATMARYGRAITITAVAIVVVAGVVWLVRRRVVARRVG